ncbi:MAG: methyltransferase domain-containing protein [Pseudomonadota bacterium]|nr:methyltransferase domain-containing protein [Pseudomonadota bacterium]
MFVRNNPDIDYDTLEVEVRQRMAELDRRRQDQEAGGQDARESFEVNSLAELYALDDEDFIQAAYHSFLGRDADPEGFAHYLSLLQEGVSKSAVAAGLRYSRAGRARPQRFRLRKAWLSWIATRTPVVGGLLESLLALLGVAGLKRNLLQLQRQVALQSREMNALQRALMLAEHEQNQLRDALAARLEQSLERARQRAERDFTALRDEHRLLREQVRGLSTGSAQTADGDDLVDEDFYLAFETHFRGPDALIRERLAFYLPVIRERLPAALASLPALDIGCGRGEWLAMLREAGYQPVGIDLNRRNVETCAAKGLDAHQADGIDWLRALAGESVALISAFHVIEHLSLGQLNSLLVEALRVLKPGGLVIFETPNPENLITAAHHFYTDPTHRNPLPPTLVEFLLDYRGFADIRTHRLHPLGKLPAADDELARQWGALLHGPQDYAVIARKPGC